MTPMEQAAEMAGKALVTWAHDNQLSVVVVQVQMVVQFKDANGGTHACGVTLGSDAVLHGKQADVRAAAAPFTANN